MKKAGKKGLIIKLIFYLTQFKMCLFSTRNKNFDFTHRVHVPRGDQRSFQRLKRKHSDFSKTNFGKLSGISEFDSGLPDLKKHRK